MLVLSIGKREMLNEKQEISRRLFNCLTKLDTMAIFHRLFINHMLWPTENLKTLTMKLLFWMKPLKGIGTRNRITRKLS